jgi:hypothetical protein
VFNAAMGAKAHGAGDGILASYDFSGFGLIGDIGGGSGHLLRAVLDECCMDSIRDRKEAIRLLFPDQRSTGWPNPTILHVSPPRKRL